MENTGKTIKICVRCADVVTDDIGQALFHPTCAKCRTDGNDFSFGHDSTINDMEYQSSDVKAGE